MVRTDDGNRSRISMHQGWQMAEKIVVTGPELAGIKVCIGVNR